MCEVWGYYKILVFKATRTWTQPVVWILRASVRIMKMWPGLNLRSRSELAVWSKSVFPHMDVSASIEDPHTNHTTHMWTSSTSSNLCLTNELWNLHHFQNDNIMYIYWLDHGTTRSSPPSSHKAQTNCYKWPHAETELASCVLICPYTTTMYVISLMYQLRSGNPDTKTSISEYALGFIYYKLVVYQHNMY